MRKCFDVKRSNIIPYIAMSLGAFIGSGFNNIGLGMLAGLTGGILYEDYKKKKVK